MQTFRAPTSTWFPDSSRQKKRKTLGRMDACIHVSTYHEPASGRYIAVAYDHDSSSFLRPMRVNGVPVMNLHPALPGELPCPYDGADAIERAFRDFPEGKLENNRTGLMIHYVIEEVDRGESILTKEIECKKGEDLHQLLERFHAQEHDLIVSATAKVVSMLMAKRAKGPDNNE